MPYRAINWQWWVEEHYYDSLGEWYAALGEVLPQIGSKESTFIVEVEWPLWKQMGWANSSNRKNNDQS